MANWTTHERHYRYYKECFLKRTLKPSEYQRDYRGEVHIPLDNAARLENEAAALNFIRQKTDIPVPRVLEAGEHNDGSYHLLTELVHGVPLKDIAHARQPEVINRVKGHLETLQSLQSSRIGGPTGIVCLPPVVKNLQRNETWMISSPSPEEYVFCHNDLSQSNIIVNPDTLEINGIIDWEFAGYFPKCFDVPFYRSTEPSGAQIRTLVECGGTRELKEFFEILLTYASIGLPTADPVTEYFFNGKLKIARAM